MPTPRLRAAVMRAAALLLTSGLLVSACGLPTPNGVRVDQQVPDPTVDAPEIRKLPPGPAAGQTPEQVALGFLEAAAAAPDSGHALAREFLAPGAQWDDSGVAMVYDATTLRLRRSTGLPAPAARAPRPVGPLAPATVGLTLTADAVALLDPDGGIRPSGRPLRLALRMVRTGDGWRITSVPRGVVLTPRDLSRGYSSAVLWTAAPGGGVLAPHPVALPGDRTALPGAVVRALLARLSPDGAGSSVSGSTGPPHVGLVGSVVLDGRTAVVDLSRGAYGLDDASRDLLLAEVAATLGSLPTVESVRVLADGRPLPGGQLDAGVPAALSPGSLGAGFAVGAGGLLRLTDAGVAGGTGGTVSSKPVAGSAASAGLAAAVPSPDSRRLAVVTGDGQGGALLTEPLTGTGPVTVGQMSMAVPGGVTGAAWLPDGTLLASRSTSPHVLAVPPVGAPRPVVEPPNAGEPVSALAVDPTGTRVAAAVGPAGQSRLWLADVTTGPQGAQLTGWEPASAQLGAVSALGWSDPLTLLVAGQVRGGRPGLTELKLTAPVVLGSLPTAGLPTELPDGTVDGIGAAPGRPLLVSAADRLWQQSGGAWRDIGPGRAPAWPG